MPGAPALLRRLAVRPAMVRALRTTSVRASTSLTGLPMASSECSLSSANLEIDEAEAQQLMGILEMLDKRAEAPVYAGCKWQADAFGVWTMVPWSDTVSFSAEVTSPGRVTRNGVEYRWHQHRASPYDDALAAPRGVWAAVN